jgi:hypothetical protein
MRRYVCGIALGLLAVLIIPLGACGARWIDVGAPSGTELNVRVVEADEWHTIIEMEMGGFWVMEREEDGDLYHLLTIPGAGWLSDIGRPHLPVVSRLVAVPPAGPVQLEILDREEVVLEGYHVYPAQKPLPELMAFSGHPFTVDSRFYLQDLTYPERQAEIVRTEQWRDYYVAQVVVNPIRTNPSKGQLVVCRRMLLEIKGSGSLPASHGAAPTKTFDRLYRRFLVNYDAVRPAGLPSTGQYLVIVPDMFYSDVVPLAEWKHKKGIQAHVTKLSEIGVSPDENDIKQYIQDAYDTWDPKPEWILLAGDTDRLPCFYRKSYYPAYYQYYGCDHPYSLLDGYDIFSDVFVGRLPGQSGSQVATMVNKLLNYETDPYMGSISWYKKYTGVCITQHGRLFDYTTGMIGKILDAYGYTQTDSLNSPAASAISDSIEAGRSFVTYRGHGWPDSWESVDYYYYDVDALNNGEMLPTVIAPTCLANAYFDDTLRCMGEAFVNQDQGGTGYFGATDVSYSYYNDSLAIGIFRGICEEHIYSFQAACNYGKVFMEQYYPLPDDITEETFYYMNILGDPEMPMWTDVPATFTVDHPDTIGIGSSDFTVTVKRGSTPVAGAVVCLFKDGEVYLTQETDGQGKATFTPSPSTTGTLAVTVTTHNFVPYQGSTVVSGEQPQLTISVMPDATTVPRGGWLGYTVEVTNNSSSSVTFDYWSDVYLWTGEPYGKNPVFGPKQATLNAYQTRSAHLSHKVPNNAPLRTYSLCGRVGGHPGDIWAEDCFGFTVVE